MSDEALDPCPFCGGNAEVISLFNSPPHGRTFVRCLSCFSSGPAARMDLAIQAWNRRPERDALRAALRNIAEGNLGDQPWQANYDRIRAVAVAALNNSKPRDETAV